MVIHKNTRLTPFQRRQIYKSYHEDQKKVSDLAEANHVPRPTIYKVLQNGRHKDFMIHKSVNKRFRCLQYGIKRLAKVEAELEAKLKSQAKRYNKDYPGQMVHGDTKRLPLLEGQKTLERREYLFVAIDDHSRAMATQGNLQALKALVGELRDIASDTYEYEMLKAQKKAEFIDWYTTLLFPGDAFAAARIEKSYRSGPTTGERLSASLTATPTTSSKTCRTSSTRRTWTCPISDATTTS